MAPRNLLAGSYVDPANRKLITLNADFVTCTQ